MIHVVLADDHQMVRAGLRALLEKSGEFQVVAEASNGQEAVDLCEKHKPDVLIMDIIMPRLNGIQAAQRIREIRLPVRILLLTMYSEESLVHQALLAGVNGYVLKSSISDELLWATRAAARGEIFLSSPISSIILESSLRPVSADQPKSLIDRLSLREKEVLQLIAEGYTSHDIAEMLTISEKTVERHRSNIMDKVDIHNLAGLVRLAVRCGLVDKEL